MANKAKVIYVILGGNPSRLDVLKEKDYSLEERMSKDLFVVGLPSEIDELEKRVYSVGISDEIGRLHKGSKSWDTLTNFAIDIRQILNKEKHYLSYVLEMQIPTSPGHFWRCEKVLKMMKFFYPSWKNIKLIHINYGEQDDPIETKLRPFYWTWLGILTFCSIAFMKRKIFGK